MTDSLPVARPVARWLHVWAVVTVVATLVLLAIGQLVTSFGAGMADRVWPTEPWYVFRTATDSEKARFREEFAFFIEHTHRIAAWTVGGLVIVLAAGLLWTDPRGAARWAALVGAVVLVAGFGEFHRGMRAQTDRPAAEVVLPVGSAGIAVAGMVVMLGAVASGAFTGARGAGLRVLGALALVAVMIQGLLGGFRVKLNELAGTDLAAFHGVFAQVFFGFLVAIAVLSARPRAGAVASRWLGHWSVVLAALILVQVIFGAMVRHFPVALSQRLHFLTAFAATALAVWVLGAIFADSAARRRAGWVAWALAALIALQLYLGVEAWLARFGQYVPPEMVKVTAEGGAIRTAHALIGSGVWAAALALALRLRRTDAPAVHTLEGVGSAWAEPRPHAAARTPEGVVTRFRGDAQC